MLRCGRRLRARSRLRRSPRSKRSGEALLVKNSSSRRLLPSPSSRVLTRGSTRQPWTPRVQQASVEAALETSREAGAHRAGFGGDVGMLLSLLAEAIRKGQQQCYLRPGIRNQDLESFLVSLGQLHSFFPGPQVPTTHVRNHRNWQHHTTQFRLPSQLLFPVS